MNENLLSFIEFCLVGVIVIIQTYVGLKARMNIRKLKYILPPSSQFGIRKYFIPRKEVESQNLRKILDDLPKYAQPESSYQEVQHQEFEESSENNDQLDPEDGHYEELIYQEQQADQEMVYQQELPLAETPIESYKEKIDSRSYKPSFETVEVGLLKYADSSSETYDHILDSVNVYLIKNKGAATDFNLIRDIVERNVYVEEEELNQSVTIPLYLGLMGTMLGIIFGLFNLFLTSSGTEDEFNITPFLIGVSIAMFASLYGLFWTVMNSNVSLKNVNIKIEKAKNNFYTFIQTELLPIINQGISSSVYTLQTNLVEFNNNFTRNIDHLTGLLNQNHDALIAQDNILTAIDNIDITEFAKANIKVLKELKDGTSELEKFNVYTHSIQKLIADSTRLSATFKELFDKVNNFENVAQKLESKIDDSNEIIKFFKEHYETLGSHGDVMEKAVHKLDDTMIKSLGQLEEHTLSKIQAIKEITIQEKDALARSVNESGTYFAKLALLEDLNKSMDGFVSGHNSQLENITKQISELKAGLEKTSKSIEEASINSFSSRAARFGKSIGDRIRELFGQKK